MIKFHGHRLEEDVSALFVRISTGSSTYVYVFEKKIFL